MRFAFLGGELTLCLTGQHDMATLEGDVLHLPLPPAATARQIQDGVEAWLRQAAAELIVAGLTPANPHARAVMPQWAFSFAAQADWVQLHPDGSLRFNWRLIELPRAEISRIVAVAALTSANQGSAQVTADLWGNEPASP
ncbi:MAG: DUF45 domain-containing protein [Sterolibacterium sp.]|nr:DUF45 domain-containing protein [Sterolibacterium sp.]